MAAINLMTIEQTDGETGINAYQSRNQAYRARAM
jgi:hypothetical protein